METDSYRTLPSEAEEESQRPVSTLPIRNGNSINGRSSSSSSHRGKYLTYKEWKQTHRYRLCLSYHPCKYLTYKEWKHCFKYP